MGIYKYFSEDLKEGGDVRAEWDPREGCSRSEGSIDWSLRKKRTRTVGGLRGCDRRESPISSFLQVCVIPNSHLSVHIRDCQIISAATEINGQNWSMTIQDTLKYSSMGVPDSNRLIP